MLAAHAGLTAVALARLPLEGLAALWPPSPPPRSQTVPVMRLDSLSDLMKPCSIRLPDSAIPLFLIPSRGLSILLTEEH